eukprot:6535231-Pyramimonas_sp.AAC.1
MRLEQVLRSDAKLQQNYDIDHHGWKIAQAFHAYRSSFMQKDLEPCFKAQLLAMPISRFRGLRAWRAPGSSPVVRFRCRLSPPLMAPSFRPECVCRTSRGLLGR